MSLKNKFLKYHSGITYAIFEEFWNKMYSLNWECYDCSTCKELWEEFSGCYPFLQDYGNEHFIASDHLINNKITEVSIAEIISNVNNNLEKAKKDLSEEELMAKARHDYPIGTTYKSASNGTICIVEKPNFKFISLTNIWGEPGKGLLYSNGRWAEIINQPPIPSSEHSVSQSYKSGDYVVCLNHVSGKNGEKDHCYKILKMNNSSFDFKSSGSISLDDHSFRLATPEEIIKYNQLGYKIGQIWKVYEASKKHNNIYVERDGERTVLAHSECDRCYSTKEENKLSFLPDPEVNELGDVSFYFPIVKEINFD